MKIPMSLLETIAEDYKIAFRSSDKATVEVLRVLKSALMNEEIAKRGKTGQREVMLTDEETLAVIKRQVKQLEEARELFTQGGRADMAAQNEKEIMILKKYLPGMLSETAVRDEVKKILEKIGAIDKSQYGKLMGQVMKELGGKADGGVVGKILKELLS